MLDPANKRNALHKLFMKLPFKIQLYFSTCRETCQSLAFEENLKSIKSKRSRWHILFCYQCWCYYKQMTMVNDKLCDHFKEVQRDVKGPGDIKALAKKYSRPD